MSDKDNMWTWQGGSDNEIWDCDPLFSCREDAIADAKSQYGEGSGECFETGQVKLTHLKDLMKPASLVDYIEDQLQDQAFQLMGEVAEGFPTFTVVERESLSAAIEGVLGPIILRASKYYIASSRGHRA